METTLRLTTDNREGDDDERRGEYRVELDVYNGPMDLLLYLIKRDELDIYDIPIARSTDSYLSYVKLLRSLKDRGGLDINVAGEFLVMAATLMEIKSATMLPMSADEAIMSARMSRISFSPTRARTKKTGMRITASVSEISLRRMEAPLS